MSLEFAARHGQLADMVSDMIRLETEEQHTLATPSAKSEMMLQKTYPKHRPVSAPNLASQLDPDYERFANNLLAEQYATRRAEFQHLEDIIALLDRKCNEAQTTTPQTIAPFNSELPVLNISTCIVRKQQQSAAPTTAAAAAAKAHKTTTGCGKSKNVTSSTKAILLPLPVDVAPITPAKAKEKNATRKPTNAKRDRGRRANRLKLSHSYLLLDPVDDMPNNPMPYKKDEAMVVLKAPAASSAAADDDDVDAAAAAVVVVEDNGQKFELSVTSSVSNESVAHNMSSPDDDRSAEMQLRRPGTQDVVHPVSSQDILALNIKTLQQQTILTQQQQLLADVQNREMMTFYLRQKLCRTAGICLYI